MHHKNLFCLASCGDYIFMDEPNDEDSSWTGREASSLLPTFPLEDLYFLSCNSAINVFDRVHSTYFPFCPVKYWGHWSGHDDIQVTMTKFDHGQFQMNTYIYGTWYFGSMIIICWLILVPARKCLCVIMQLKDHFPQRHVFIWNWPWSNIIMVAWMSSRSVQWPQYFALQKWEKINELSRKGV